MAVHTALDLITASLKRLGVVSGIQTPSADLAADGLDRLNSLIDSWLTESLVVYARQRVTKTMTIGKAAYTIGPAGDFVITPRPAWLYTVAITIPGSNPVSELELTPLDEDEWATTSIKTQASSQPDRYYYNATWPLGSLSPWPVLSVGSCDLVVYAAVPLPTDLVLTTAIDLPSGYYRALRDNLAIELAPELDRQVDPNLFMIATDAKAAIKRVNFRPLTMQVDEALSCGAGEYNWLTDE